MNYIFKYDPRPTTRSAESLSDDIPEEVKKERNRRLLDLSARVGLRRTSSYVGREVQAFLESRSDRREGTLLGRTIHGLPVSVAAGDEWLGRLSTVLIKEATAFGMSGELRG